MARPMAIRWISTCEPRSLERGNKRAIYICTAYFYYFWDWGRGYSDCVLLITMKV
jgi:hypothetical protein